MYCQSMLSRQTLPRQPYLDVECEALLYVVDDAVEGVTRQQAAGQGSCWGAVRDEIAQQDRAVHLQKRGGMHVTT
jgi:hypothetical protein